MRKHILKRRQRATRKKFRSKGSEIFWNSKNAKVVYLQKILNFDNNEKATEECLGRKTKKRPKDWFDGECKD